MGCPTSVIIGKNLTFSIVTHDPDTGVLTDAASAPTYRVYEEETATPILTGSMAKLDDANTTGFYTELVACTAANGFEDGKCYNIYIAATVDGDTGGITYGFRAMTASNDISVTDVTQRQIPDSVPADGTRPTIEQALYMITQFLMERAVSGTTVTVKKVDGSTSLLTLTLDDDTDPTSITRSG